MESTLQKTHSNFGGLPAELRLKIFEQMTPPADSRLADWKGIFLSCRLVHYEMKYELLRNMKKYLEQIQADWMKIYNTALRISTPTSIAEVEKISIAIPNSYFRTREAMFPATRTFSAALVSLIQLGISQLSFGRYEDDKTMKRTTARITEHSIADFMNDLLALMKTSKPPRTIKLDDGTGHVVSHGSTINKTVFEWGIFDGATGDEDLILPHYAEDCPSDRTVELMRDHVCGPATGAIWTRRQYTWYGQVVESFWEEAHLSSSK